MSKTRTRRGGTMFKVFMILNLSIFGLEQTYGCSAFYLQGLKPFMAKSYDWHSGAGHLFSNKRNMFKVAIPSSFFDIPTTWISHYGSLTFNQFGREFPHGGMNEKGLSIELLWLKESEYPNKIFEKKINELQWIQYQLDLSADIEELMVNAQKVTVKNAYAKVHYFACDRFGECAVIEYLNGELVVSNRLTYKAITNNSVSSSAEYLKNFIGFGGDLEIPTSEESLDRFVRLADGIKSSSVNDSESRVFEILRNVYQTNYTRWNIVYDLTRNLINLKTEENPIYSTIDLNNFDFSCKKHVVYHDVNARNKDEISSDFILYSKAENTKMIKRSLSSIPDGPSDKEQDFMANFLSLYPETTRCLE